MYTVQADPMGDGVQGAGYGTPMGDRGRVGGMIFNLKKIFGLTNRPSKLCHIKLCEVI